MQDDFVTIESHAAIDRPNDSALDTPSMPLQRAGNPVALAWNKTGCSSLVAELVAANHCQEDTQDPAQHPHANKRPDKEGND